MSLYPTSKRLAEELIPKNNTMSNDLFGNAINAGAEFSEDRKYRYSLWRIWQKELPLVMFIGLNPSTANEDENDPTIKSVCRIAKHNGYGGVYMMNCWAYIATKPEDLKVNPMSTEWNNTVITLTAAICKDVVFAWGNFKIVKEHGRDKELVEMFPRAKALHINANGSPKHPLYCKSNSTFINFNP